MTAPSTSMRRALECLLFALCIHLVLTQVAAAESDRERARQHVVDGDALKLRAEEAKSDGDAERAADLFQESADEYQAAYNLVPHPLMLYNLAQVYRLAGDAERSLTLYQEFLDSNPSGEAAEFARKYVKILERAIARTKEREANGKNDGPQGDDDDDTTDDDDDTGDDDDDTDDDDDIVDDDDSPASGGANDGMRYGGLGLAAAGVVAIAVGVKFGLDARDISDYLSNFSADNSQWTDEALALQDEGKTAEQRMFLLSGLGAALIVGGGVLYYLGGRESPATDRQAAFRVTPSIDAHGAGFALSGHF